MKNLIFASKICNVAHDIHKHLSRHPQDSSVVFIDTATEVEEGDLQWIEDDRQSLEDAGFKLTKYTITGKDKEQIRDTLEKYDVIYMSGGNAFYLLQKMQETKCMDVIADLVEKGKPYIGSSSGAIVAGPNIEVAEVVVPKDKAPGLDNYTGLGLVDFTIIPHWGSTHPEWVDIFLPKGIQKAYGDKNKLVLLSEFQYVVVREDWFKIVDVVENTV